MESSFIGVLAEKLNLFPAQVQSYVLDIAAQNQELYIMLYSAVIMIAAILVFAGGLFLVSYFKSRSRAKYIPLALGIMVFIIAAFLIGYSGYNIIDWQNNAVHKTEIVLLEDSHHGLFG